MRTGRPKKPIILSDQEHEQLTSIVRSRSLPAWLGNASPDCFDGGWRSHK